MRGRTSFFAVRGVHGAHVHAAYTANTVNFFSNPLDAVPDEVALENSPLKLAFAKIHFPAMLSIGQSNSSQVTAFQECVWEDYPNYEEHVSVSLMGLGAHQQIDAQSQISHIFKNDDGWEIGLNRDAIALSTTKYETRDEFVGKFAKMMEAAKKSFNPSKVIRLGVRFIDRIEDESIIKDLDKYVNPAFLTPFPNFPKIAHQSSLTQQHMSLDNNAFMNLQWGLFPPNQPIPNVNMQPCQGVSWVLDSDMYKQDFTKFEADEITSDVDNFSNRIYAIFRHVFNDDFIRLCGGKI